MGQRKKIFSNYSFIFACGLAFVGAGFAIGGLFVSKNNQVAQQAFAEPDAVPYMAWDEDSKSVKSVEGGCTEYTVVTDSTTSWSDGWYVVNGGATISSRITVTGTTANPTNLILCDGATLTANDGISVNEDQTLNIYCQSLGTGALIASAADSEYHLVYSVIGGHEDYGAGTINIHGGNITATNGEYSEGAAIGGTGSYITIYGGNITANASHGAGIGGDTHGNGGNITIYGGTINTTSGQGAAIGGGSRGNGGNITIYGGNITAVSTEDGAGIGGGAGYSGGSIGNGGNITIYGGVVIAKGNCGAAIGGGSNGAGGTITINGGTVTATNLTNGAGIGGGQVANGGTINITGGTVYATGGAGAAGIGGGDFGNYGGTGGNVTISGGTVYATGGSESVGIGAGKNSTEHGSLAITETSLGVFGGDSEDPTTKINKVNDDYARYRYMVVTSTTYSVTFNTNGGTINAGNISSYQYGTGATLPSNVTKDKNTFAGWYNNSTFTGDPITAISSTESGDKEYWAKWEENKIPYCAWDEGSQTVKEVPSGCDDFTTVDSATTSWSDGGWYVVKNDVTIGGRINVNGTANLILCDGATLTASKGITLSSGRTLNIYAQTNGTGALIATGSEQYYAGIGGSGGDCGTLNIHGGIVTASGGNWAAGIGGGFRGNGGNVTIYGGVVTANGSGWAAGIGGSYQRGGGNVTVYGGHVFANGGTEAQGIGHGRSDSNQGTLFVADNLAVLSGSNVIEKKNDDYARYQRMIVTSYSPVTFNTNGGTINSGNLEEYPEGAVITLPTDVTKDEYVFGGWFKNSEFTGEAFTTTLLGDKGELEYWARWDRSITYHLNDGYIDEGNVTQYYEGDGATLPIKVTKDSCVFGGWFDNEGLTGNPVTSISAEATGNKEFWAKWYGYYLVGDMNDNKMSEEYRLTYNSKNTENDEYYYDIDLTASNNFKVAYGSVGEDIQNLYPAVGDGYGENGEITEDKAYRVTFRPDGEGGEGWFNGYLKTEENLPYMAWDESSQTVKNAKGGCGGYNVVTNNTTSWTNGEWYVVNSDVTIGSRVNVSGTVNLILCDGASLKATKGIGVNAGNTLNIYAQALGTGTLTASSYDYWDSGIGGTQKNSAGNINIHGGIINATGVYNNQGRGAGIGGGYQNAGGTVNVYGGFVTATGGKTGGAGIGGGQDGNGGTLNVYGGIVFAYGNSGAAGIGHGRDNSTNGTLTVADHLAVLNGTTIIEKQNDDYERPSNMAITKISPVSFNENGGTIHSGSFDQYPEGSVLNLPSDITKEGYVFAGWFKNAELNGESFTSTLTTDRDALEYWARWDRSITYNLNGGTINEGNIPHYHEGVGLTLPSNVTKAGCVFAGWFDNENCTGEAITNLDAEARGDKEYWAKWLTYYLVGDMNEWALNENNQLTYNSKNTEYEEYYFDIDLNTSNNFKIGYGYPGEDVMTWYPDGMGNSFGEHGEITAAGPYRIFFRPDGLGGEGWFNGLIKIEENLSYYAWDEDSKTLKPVPGGCGGYNVVDSNTTSWTNGEWYVVNSDVTVSGRINVSGTANLILCDGATLTASGGITVVGSNTLNIFAQENGTGALIARSSAQYCAGIGGTNQANCGTVNIHGGNITASGAGWAAGIGGGFAHNGGTLNVYGGTIIARGGQSAAGIGAGWQSNGGNVTILGGRVFAYGGSDAMGIGRGRGGTYGNGTLTVADGLIVLRGTTVTAKDGNGNYARSQNMAVTIMSPITFHTNDGTINSGNISEYGEGVAFPLPTDVTREGFVFAGWYDNSELSGEVVTQTPISASGALEYWANWDYKIVYNLNGGTINDAEYPTQYTGGVGATLPTDVTRDHCVFAGWFDNENCAGTVVAHITTEDTGAKEYWAKWLTYYVVGDMSGWNIDEDYKLIYNSKNTEYEEYYIDLDLSTSSQIKAVLGFPGDDATVYYPDGMGNSFGEHGEITAAGPYRIFFRPDGLGGEGWFNGLIKIEKNLSYYAWDGNALSSVPGGINDSDYTVVGSDTINWSNGYYVVAGEVTIDSRISVTGTVHLILTDGSTLNATKGINVEGVNIINIYGQASGTGVLNATATDVNAAGIGSSSNKVNGAINIHGGNITALGAENGPGIGGKEGQIIIYGGNITATGGERGAGIGGGNGCVATPVTIYGGTIVAQGGFGGAGIGSGYVPSAAVMTPIVINGGHVTARGGENSAGIGGAWGANGSGLAVTINDGVVFTSGYKGIGRGQDGQNDGTLVIDDSLNVISGTTIIEKINDDYARSGNMSVSNLSSISFNPNGGTIVSGEFNKYVEGANKALPNNVTKDGFVFVGWCDNEELTGELYFAIPVDAKGDLTYYAKWNKTITYHTNGGTINGEYPTNYHEGEGITLPTNITKDGYFFDGWYDNEELSGSPIISIATDVTGDKEYWANWKAYYVVGSMTNWGVNSQYKLTRNSEPLVEEYYFDIPLNTTDSLKVVLGSELNGVIYTWYPDGTGNAYGDNGEITFNSIYRVYFRPNGDGGEGWFHNVMYVKSHAALVGDTPYLTLKDAYTAVSAGGTIKLLDNVDLTSEEDNYLTVLKNFTLDLNGHILDITSDVSQNKYKVKVLDGAILTVDDSSANVGGVKGACGVDYANSSYLLLKNIRLSLDVQTIKEASALMHIAEGFILVPTNNGAPDADGFLSLVRPITDQDYADAVDELINNIGVVEYTDASGNKIKEARDAYKALTDAQKALVSKYDILTTAEAAYSTFAINYINSLVNVPEITLDKEEDVIKARTAYDALTDEEKANIPELVVYRLVVAEKEINDIKQSNASIAEINALPAVGDLTLDNKDAVIAARATYDALSSEGKEKVPSSVVNKLIAAEKEIKDIEESNNSINQINALPAVGDLTLDNKDAVIAARAAYDALSPEGREKVGDLVNTLVAAETQIKYLTDVKESTEASALINALPAVDDLTLDNKDAVLEAKAAYDALSTEGKAMVSSELATKINELAVKMKNLVDEKESTDVTELIEDLPDVSEVTKEDKDAVNQAREQYRNLSPEGKAMVSEEDLLKLIELERTLNDIEAPAAVNKSIDELPSLDELTLDDKDAVLAAEKAYDRLSPEGKKAVPEEKIAKVEAAIERIAQLEKEKEQQEVEDFVSLVESLPSPENVTLDDAEKVMEAYRNQKKFYGKVPESLMNQLDLVYRALDTLQRQAQIGRTWYVGYTYDWITGFFNRPNDSIVAIRDHTLVSIEFLSGNTFRFTFSGKTSWGQAQTYNFDFEVEGDKVPTGLRIISGTGDWDEETAYNFGVVYEPAPVVSANKISLEIEESINHVVGRVVTVNATFEPTYTTNQEVKWSVSGNGILLYEDKDCTVLVDEETTQKTVYAKFVAAGDYDIVATARNDESLQAVLSINITENDPIIGRKWFIGDSFEANSSFWYRYYSGYGSNLANKDLNGAILVSIYNTQGYNTCYFLYEKPVGGDDDFSLDVDNPEILPTGLTFVSGDGTHDNPYIVNAIYDEAPYVGVKDIDLSVSTIQYAFVEGQVAILDAKIDPYYAFNQNVIWTISSDSVLLYTDFECTTPLTNGITDIHTVYAKAEKAGNAIITVTSVDNGAANASYVVDVVSKEGLVPFDYTLWTTYGYNKTWYDAYLEVRDVETGEAAARLTLTGDRDREDYLDQNHDKWGTNDTIYLPFGKNYELVWSKTPLDGGWDDRYYNFTFTNPTTIDTIIDTAGNGCGNYEQNQVVATFLSTTEPIVRIELSNDSLSVLDGKATVVTPFVKPGAVENKTLTWSINKEGVVSLFADSSCTEALPAIIDTDTPIYVKGLDVGVATITLTSVQDNNKVVYIPVIVHDSNTYTTYKYQLSDSYGDGWNGAELSFRNKATGIVAATLTMTNDDPNLVNGELMLLQGEYELVWKKGGCDNECSFVLYDSDDNVLLDSSTVTLNEGVLATIGTPIEDSIIVSATEKLINSLHEVKDIKLFEKQEIQLVRDYYDNLTKEQQELISGDILAKLLAAEKEINDIETSMAVDKLINELPAFKDIVLDDKDQIMAAKEAYDALSDEAKAKLPKEDVEALNAAVKEINDIEESNASTEEINALPVVGELTLDDKDAVIKARADYDALSPEGKAKVDPEVLAKLVAAEKEINDIETAKETSDMISELPVVGELTLEDKGDVEAARAAYDALTEYQKGKVSTETLAKLVAAETEIKDIEAAKDADDKINALPVVGVLTLEDKDDVEAAKAAYDALTDYQKGKVSAESVAKLNAALTEINDIETAKETSDMINALPVVGELTLEDKADVEAARAAYDALTEYQKGKVSTETLAKLVAAETEIKDIEAARAAAEQIDELPSLDDITGMDEKDVDAAEAAIDALTPEAIAKLTDEELAKLEEAKAAITEIKSIVVTEDSGNKSFTRDVDAKAAEEGVNVKQTFKTAANDEAKTKELTIKAGDVTVSFDANAVNEIGNKATTISVKLTYPEQGPEAKVDVSLNGVKFDTGISTVSFKYNKSIPAGMQAVVRYVDAEGNKTTMKTWMENDVISFETNHFSTFIVEYELSAGAIALIIVGSILALLLLVGIVLFILDRMHVIHIAFIDRLFDKKAKEEQPVEQVQENEASNEENEEVVTVSDEKGNIFQIRFIKSFTAKLIQSPDETKKYYEVLKNYVLSYKKTNSRVSWHFDSINAGREQVLKFVIRGKTLGVYFPLNADDYADSKYKVEKVESKKFEDVPCLYRIKNDRRCDYAKELIDVVMNNLGLEKGEEQKESYYLHYEENKPLIARGLIKELKVQVNKPARETQILSVVTDEDGEEVVTKRDSKGNIFQIRYIKSFTAKLSQADDELKDYYNELKNYALSYKKANSRISWHFDSINVGRNQVLKFVIRGKTLCLYYALNADDYAESKYKVEKVESKKYEDVPCLYRIKNDRRRDYAKDLIDTVMANVPTEKGKESNEDFRVPYETTEALLEKGLIKELKVQVNNPASRETQILSVVTNDDGDEVITKQDRNGNIFEIRYIKSFTAKLSQAEQELKDYYNELKNYALGYKKANSRVSWHFDSINVGRNQVLKFVIRGKTLCLYYALNADDYADSKYKVEKVESKKYEDVPCLYRIKNDRRCEYAKELIDTVMANVPTEKGKESNEEFRIPFEETKVLLEKGLIKEVKTKVEAKEEVIQSITVEEADKQMSDEKAEASIEIDTTHKKRIGKKEIINIDTLSNSFNNGEEVTIEALIAKKLIPSKTGSVKLLARGTLDKKLTVCLNDYSLQAVKMIALLGGQVKIIK